MSFTAPKAASLLEILQLFSPESSKTTLKKWIKSKRVYVNDEVANLPTDQVIKGASITLGARKEYFKGKMEILYQDSQLVVIYKPEGLLSVATDKELFYTAHDLLKTKYPPRRVYPVHRLDRDTSGVMLFAYTPEARDHLKKQFEKHSIYREYHALLLGRLEEKKGIWKSYLAEDSFCYVYECEKKDDAQLAITEFEVLKEFKTHSLVKFALQTGRKNQIRVQAAHRGHPVLGDKKYGPYHTTVPRLCLHAHELHFVHPSTLKLMRFSYPAPKEFQNIRPSIASQNPSQKSFSSSTLKKKKDTHTKL